MVETEKIEDSDQLKHIFSAYQAQGMKVFLDDVGTGFNTIEVVEALKPNVIKLDRSLIAMCDHDQDKQDRINQKMEVAKRWEQQYQSICDHIYVTIYSKLACF